MIELNSDALKATPKQEPDITLGVGDGSGKLFVHGDYDSIKACQAKIFRMEKAERELQQTREERDTYTEDFTALGVEFDQLKQQLAQSQHQVGLLRDFINWPDLLREDEAEGSRGQFPHSAAEGGEMTKSGKEWVDSIFEKWIQDTGDVPDTPLSHQHYQQAEFWLRALFTEVEKRAHLIAIEYGKDTEWGLFILDAYPIVKRELLGD